MRYLVDQGIDISAHLGPGVASIVLQSNFSSLCFLLLFIPPSRSSPLHCAASVADPDRV